MKTRNQGVSSQGVKLGVEGDPRGRVAPIVGVPVLRKKYRGWSPRVARVAVAVQRCLLFSGFVVVGGAFEFPCTSPLRPALFLSAIQAGRCALTLCASIMCARACFLVCQNLAYELLLRGSVSYSV